MALKVNGKTIAYVHTLHVPQLSAILLSTRRVHRRAAQGCSFIADHSGCFLTFPNFNIELDDDEDCTISCKDVDPNITQYDFNSRRHVSQHSFKAVVATC
jgi:hypothetical protein